MAHNCKDYSCVFGIVVVTRTIPGHSSTGRAGFDSTGKRPFVGLVAFLHHMSISFVNFFVVMLTKMERHPYWKDIRTPGERT